MSTKTGCIACIGCGALVPDVDGSTHRYVGASAGCWAIFNAVSVRHYENTALGAVHQFLVDAYMAQHPGTPSPQSTQSVTVHLISLCLAFEHGYDPSQRIAALRTATHWRNDFAWLTPPAALGSLTIANVHDAQETAAQIAITQAYARAVWDAWSVYHETIRQWAAKIQSR
jgi:Family of unknown function (DUF5946)